MPLGFPGRAPAVICRAGAPHHCRDPSCDRRALGWGQRCARPPALPLTLAWSPAEGRDIDSLGQQSPLGPGHTSGRGWDPHTLSLWLVPC